MKVCLLYKDRERSNETAYYDTESIIKDLGLKTLFLAAAKKLIYENGEVKHVEKEDTYLMETLRNVMMTPLESEEEITFRQDIIKDCIAHEELIRELYAISTRVIRKWNELGRGGREKLQQSNPVMKLTAEIKILHLFCDSLSQIRKLITDQEGLESEGLKAFGEELKREFSAEREEHIRRVLGDVSFYTDGADDDDEGKDMIVRPKIVMECGLEDGLKFSSLKLEEVSSVSEKFYKPGSTRYKLREFKNSRIPDSFSTVNDMRIKEQAETLEYGIVSYLVEELKRMMESFQTFFDRLRFQSAFYLAAIQLKAQIERLGAEWCFPKVCDRRDLEFTELKELVMGLQSRMDSKDVVGNTCTLKEKDLLIVTGANQGGKSTFLRSIGIAQVMMQCGLMVLAQSYQSGIFPHIFVHFTRREDSEMNSGRLDEELGRMNGIVEHIGDGSLLLLNESFATTTEKEGSVIAYDIIKALKEAGVRILTVTHLLSFARRIHEESKNEPGSGVEFLSAERLPDGRRTFRMIRHEPELTSFGLDLYEDIVGNINEEG